MRRTGRIASSRAQTTQRKHPCHARDDSASGENCKRKTGQPFATIACLCRLKSREPKRRAVMEARRAKEIDPQSCLQGVEKLTRGRRLPALR